MRRPLSFWHSKGRWFPLRLALAYLIVPLTAPTLLGLAMKRGTPHASFGDWGAIIVLYAIFSFAAMEMPQHWKASVALQAFFGRFTNRPYRAVCAGMVGEPSGLPPVAASAGRAKPSPTKC